MATEDTGTFYHVDVGLIIILKGPGFNLCKYLIKTDSLTDVTAQGHKDDLPLF